MEREEEIIQHRSMTTTYHAEATNLMKTLDFELIEISGWLLLSQKTCLALSAIVGLRQLFLFFFFFSPWSSTLSVSSILFPVCCSAQDQLLV